MSTPPWKVKLRYPSGQTYYVYDRATGELVGRASKRMRYIWEGYPFVDGTWRTKAGFFMADTLKEAAARMYDDWVRRAGPGRG